MATAEDMVGSAVIRTSVLAAYVASLAPSRMSTLPAVLAPSFCTVSLNVRVSIPESASKAAALSVGAMVSAVSVIAVLAAAMSWFDVSSTAPASRRTYGFVMAMAAWRWDSVSTKVTAVLLPDELTAASVTEGPPRAVPPEVPAPSRMWILDWSTPASSAFTVSLNVMTSVPLPSSRVGAVEDDIVGFVVSVRMPGALLPAVLATLEVSFTASASI